MSRMSVFRKSGRTPVSFSMRSASAVLAPSAMSMKATRAPCRAKPSVSAAPIPDPPPVISTEAPLRSGKTADVFMHSLLPPSSCAEHRIGERASQDKPVLQQMRSDELQCQTPASVSGIGRAREGPRPPAFVDR